MEKTINANPVFTLELQEVINKLKVGGYGNIIECLMDNEAECFTKKGRFNKSAICRKTGLKTKELEDVLKNMKDLLKQEYSVE